MLVLSRQVGQSIMVGKDIEVKLLSMAGDKIRLGVEAPKTIKVLRKELLDETNIIRDGPVHRRDESNTEGIEGIRDSETQQEEYGP